MKPSIVKLTLACSAQQHARLAKLQQTFALACNRVSEIARINRCWNRVALHHLAYRVIREQFSELGSQMACNAIYSVCRACRWAYQHPKSPLRIAANASQPLAPIVFLSTAPVYFDRHTLSLMGGQLSMYTLDGRMHFQLSISQADQRRLVNEKIKEVALTQTLPVPPALQQIQSTSRSTIQIKTNSNSVFELVFWFEGAFVVATPQTLSAFELAPESLAVGPLTMQPPYLMTKPSTGPTAATLPSR